MSSSLQLLGQLSETPEEKKKLLELQKPLPDIAFLFLAKDPVFELTHREQAAALLLDQERKMQQEERRREEQQAAAARERALAKAKAKARNVRPHWAWK